MGWVKKKSKYFFFGLKVWKGLISYAHDAGRCTTLKKTTKVDFGKISIFMVYWPESVLRLGWVTKKSNYFFFGLKAWKGLISYAHDAGRHTMQK